MSARRSREVVDERDYVRVRERSRERERQPIDRYFVDEERPSSGPLVLRQREVETGERSRPRPRSPSPVRFRQVIRERSISPPSRERSVDRVEIRDRIIEHPRSRAPARVIDHSPSSSPEREDRIIIERSRSRISASPSPSPPPPQPRPVIRGPIIERDVVTHYTNYDHGEITPCIPSPHAFFRTTSNHDSGVVYAPQPPPPPPPQERYRDTEVDVYTSRRRTEVDIRETSRERRRSRSRSRVRLAPERASEREVYVRSDRNRLEVDIDERGGHRRARSAQPPMHRYDAVADEAREIETRIDDRGRMGEARNGATRDWTIIDVPPGTERVRMDGVGGGGAEVTWQRYNGVRRTRFIPERDGQVAMPMPHRKPRVSSHQGRPSREHINVQITDKKGKHRVDVDASSRLVKYAPPSRELELVPAPLNDMWTEITKDLVSREAMDFLGYEYTETEFFYYILQYLRYVSQLTRKLPPPPVHQNTILTKTGGRQ